MTKDTSSILLISKACKEFIQNDFNFDHKVIHYHKIIDLLEPNEQLQIFILKKRKKNTKKPPQTKTKTPHKSTVDHDVYPSAIPQGTSRIQLRTALISFASANDYFKFKSLNHNTGRGKG